MVRDISASLDDLPELPQGTEPEVVYHYSDVGGLLGIVQKECLWASDVWFMNDAREASYGLDVIKRAIRSAALTSDLERQVRNEVLKRLEEMPGQEDVLQSYIACLSKEGDQLSQWRAYGRPRGFSIGFDRRKLQRICTVGLELEKPSYRSVTYDKTIQVSMLSMILRTILNVPVDSPESREQLQLPGYSFSRRSRLHRPSRIPPSRKSRKCGFKSSMTRIMSRGMPLSLGMVQWG